MESTKECSSSENGLVDESTQGKSTTTGAILALVNTMIGAGLITLPRGFAEAGLVQGMVLMLFLMVISVISMYFIAVVAEKLKGRDTSYSKACDQLMPRAKVVADLVIFLQCFGVASSYLILIGNSMAMICQGLAGIFSTRYFWISIFLVFICLPLAMVESLSSLKYFSMAAMGMIFYVMILIMTFGIIRLTHPVSSSVEISAWQNSRQGTLECLSYLVFSFTCQTNMFQVINEMKCKSIKRVCAASVGAISLTGVIYTVVGVTGYIALGNEIGNDLFDEFTKGSFGEILAEFDPNLILVLIGRLAIVFLVTSCYPLQIHPCRDACIQVMKTIGIKHSHSRLVTVLICLMSFTTAMLVSDFDQVIGIVGATGSASISFIFPCLFYLLLDKRFDWTKVFAVLILLFGVGFMITFLVSL